MKLFPQKILHWFAGPGLTCLCSGLLCAASVVPAATPPPPNIVLILADDMGWNQVGYHGSKWYETTAIDKLAGEGMIFMQAYAAASVCSPTRAALLTGKSPARLHITDYIPGRRWNDKRLVTPPMQQGLPLEESTIPEMLHPLGYISGLFGKWHLAPSYDYEPWRPMDPESQGFDVVFHTNKPDANHPPARDRHNAVSITDHAIRFIEQHRDQPFFCYVSHNVVHMPLMEDPDLIAKYQAKLGADQPVNNAVMGAMIETMDRQIGRLLATLDRLGLRENTVVIFASDNGNVMAEQDQAPFRGGKGTIWEGGLRVPLAIRWPGVVPAGTNSREPVVTEDIFATIMDIAGVAWLPALHDGKSLLPLLTQRADSLDREALYWHYPHYHNHGDMRPGGVVRMGRYKLIEWYEETLLGTGPPVSLYDLDADPGEVHDLAELEPDRVRRMRTKLQAWRRGVGAQEMTVR